MERRQLEGAQRVASRLSDAGLAHLEVTEPLEGGETGVFAAIDESGVACVFKWTNDPDGFAVRAEAHAVAEALRTRAGWPIPTQSLITVADDLQVIVMARLDGKNPERLDVPLLDQLTQLDANRRGLTSQVDHIDHSRFGTELVTTLTTGGVDYCRHEGLRNHSATTRRIEARMVEIGRSYHPDDFPTDDLVHFDLHGENLLVDGDALTGIVDPEFSLVGDAGFDLVTLAVCTREMNDSEPAHKRAWELVHERVAAEFVRPYAAHVLLRCADWDLRNHGAQTLGTWLDAADRLLFD